MTHKEKVDAYHQRIKKERELNEKRAVACLETCRLLAKCPSVFGAEASALAKHALEFGEVGDHLVPSTA